MTTLTRSESIDLHPNDFLITELSPKIHLKNPGNTLSGALLMSGGRGGGRGGSCGDDNRDLCVAVFHEPLSCARDVAEGDVPCVTLVAAQHGKLPQNQLPKCVDMIAQNQMSICVSVYIYIYIYVHIYI